MLSFPNRCQYLKVNGTQCGSPALRRNRFCFFHKRHHEERIQLHTDRARRARRATIDLPALEDANSVQVSVMQILRLTLAGQLDSKTSGLALYALQIASSNLSRTTFTPFRHDVILDPRTVDQTPLDEYIWQDEDFPDADEEAEEEARLAQAREEEREKARQKAAQEARNQRLIKLHADRKAADEARCEAEQAKIKADAAARRAALIAQTSVQNATQSEAQTSPQNSISAAPLAATITPTGHAVVAPTSATENPGRRPPANVNIKEVREQIREQIRKELPAFAAVLAEKNRNTSG